MLRLQALCSVLFSVIFIITISTSNAAYIPPKVSVSKSLTKTEIEKNEWSTVKIVVTGDTRTQTQPLATSVVLAIDYSGSMGANNAYKDASAAAKNAIGFLKKGLDKLGIITIRTKSDWEIPLGLLTTANTPNINQKIDSFQPSGYTNYVEAFDKANAALKADSAPNKIVVFMSDGVPEPDTINQQNYIYANRYNPAIDGIHYYTIEFNPTPGALPNWLLKTMADTTGGDYEMATQQSDLLTLFQKAVTTGKNTDSTWNVSIKETVANNLKIRPDSLSWSPAPVTNEPIAFETAMKAIKKNFHNTTSLKTPVINYLPANHNFTLTFDVTVDTCSDEKKTPPVDAAFPASQVTYKSGGVSQSAAIPQRWLTVAPCDIHLEKTFDPSSKTVFLKVRNDYPRTVRNILVHEVTSKYFVPTTPTSPIHDKLDPIHHQVWWGSIDENKIELDSADEKTYTFTLKAAPSFQNLKGPLEIDWLRAGVSYTVDAKYFVVDSGEPGFTAFESDLLSGKISAQTTAFLKNWFTNKPDPKIPGNKLGLNFDVPVGTHFMTILTPIGQPAPEFQWILPKTSGSMMIKIKKSANQIAIHSPTLKWKKFPQAQTPVGYTP